MEWWMLGLLLMISLLLLLAIGMPIGFSLGFLSSCGIVFFLDIKQLYLLGQTAYTTPYNFVLVAVPLFIFMAEVLAAGKMSSDLFEAATNWLGRLPGGLASSSVCGCALFAALTGSSSANVAAMGTVCTPEMLKRGYDKRLATGSVAAAGALGILIPPSILMIFYGSLTDQSIAELFMAGVVPGVLIAVFFSIYITVLCKLNPNMAPFSDREVPWRRKFQSTIRIWWVLILLLVMLGGIYTGVCTPTEAAGLGATGSVVLAFAHRTLTWEKLKIAALRTVKVTCMVLFIMIGAMIFGYFLTHLGIPQQLVAWVGKLPVSRWVIMIAINILFIGLGCVLDAASIVMVTIPILYPITVSLGFDPVWFGVVATVNMEMGMITPPMGLNLFVMKGIVPPDVSIEDIIKGIAPFLLIQLFVLALVLAFPRLILWLPSTMH